MNKRILFELVFKVLGILLFVKSVEMLGQLISSITYMISIAGKGMDADTTVLASVVYPFSYVFLILILAYVFIFKSDSVAEMVIKSDDEENVDIKFEGRGLIFAAVIITGGVTLIDALPGLINDIIVNLYVRYKENTLGIDDFKPYMYGGRNIVFYLLQTVTGLILILKSKKITDFLVNRQNSRPIEES